MVLVVPVLRPWVLADGSLSGPFISVHQGFVLCLGGLVVAVIRLQECTNVSSLKVLIHYSVLKTLCNINTTIAILFFCFSVINCMTDKNTSRSSHVQQKVLFFLTELSKHDLAT